MPNKIKNKINSYTLVQLLIAIVIVTVLIGVGFLQYRNYSRRAIVTQVMEANKSASDQVDFFIANNDSVPSSEVLGSGIIPGLNLARTHFNIQEGGVLPTDLVTLLDEQNISAEEQGKIIYVVETDFETNWSDDPNFSGTSKAYRVQIQLDDGSTEWRNYVFQLSARFGGPKIECVGGNVVQGKCKCNPGYFKEVSTCKSCVSGFSLGGDSSSCSQCEELNAIGSGCNTDGTVSACLAGFELKNDSCVACEGDTYALAGINSCSACHEHSTGCSKTTGEVTGCKSGYVVSADKMSCVTCAVGKYILNGSCVVCPNSTSDNAAVKGCDNNGNPTACNTGFGLDTSGAPSVCRACAANEYSLNDKAACQSCGTGVTQCNNDGSIVSCMAGYAVNNGSCELCTAGSYRTVTMGAACEPCSNITTNFVACNPATGEPTSCVVNYSIDTSTDPDTCKPCGANEYSSGTSACQSCADLYSNTNVAKCDGSGITECLSGFGFSGTGATATCTECTGGQVSNGKGPCTDCVAPNALTCSDDGKAATCNVGYGFDENNDPRCTECLAGSYSDANVAECANCPLGTFSNQAATETCQACEKNEYADTEGSTACTSCGTGVAECDSTTGAIISCIEGYGLDATDPANKTCTKCADDQYSAGAGACKSCQPDFPNALTCDKDGALSCAGGYGLNNKACTQCAAGTFANGTTAITCEPCGEGKYAPNAGSSECITCPNSPPTCNGITGEVGGCPPGYGMGRHGAGWKFVREEGVGCERCWGGEYSPGGTAGCTECPPTKYIPHYIMNPDGTNGPVYWHDGTAYTSESQCLDCPVAGPSDGILKCWKGSGWPDLCKLGYEKRGVELIGKYGVACLPCRAGFIQDPNFDIGVCIPSIACPPDKPFFWRLEAGGDDQCYECPQDATYPDRWQKINGTCYLKCFQQFDWPDAMDCPCSGSTTKITHDGYTWCNWD